MLEKEISKYNLNFDVSSKKFKDNIIEVNTVLRLVPSPELKNKILTEDIEYHNTNYKEFLINDNINEILEIEKLINVELLDTTFTSVTIRPVVIAASTIGAAFKSIDVLSEKIRPPQAIVVKIER